jgi:hypothetical protein
MPIAISPQNQLVSMGERGVAVPVPVHRMPYMDALIGEEAPKGIEKAKEKQKEKV